MTRLEALIVKVKAVAATLDGSSPMPEKREVKVTFEPSERVQSAPWCARFGNDYSRREMSARSGTDSGAVAYLLSMLVRESREAIATAETELAAAKLRASTVDAIMLEVPAAETKEEY